MTAPTKHLMSRMPVILWPCPRRRCCRGLSHPCAAAAMVVSVETAWVQEGWTRAACAGNRESSDAEIVSVGGRAGGVVFRADQCRRYDPHHRPENRDVCLGTRRYSRASARQAAQIGRAHV